MPEGDTVRTIKVRAVHWLDHTISLELETEVLVESDDAARQAGAEAWRVLQEVLRGIAEEGGA